METRLKKGANIPRKLQLRNSNNTLCFLIEPVEDKNSELLCINLVHVKEKFSSTRGKPHMQLATGTFYVAAVRPHIRFSSHFLTSCYSMFAAFFFLFFFIYHKSHSVHIFVKFSAKSFVMSTFRE